jgi:hypothetical protein
MDAEMLDVEDDAGLAGHDEGSLTRSAPSPEGWRSSGDGGG